MRRPSVSPGPRKLRIDVRFALSYEALKMKGKFSDRVMPLMTSAMKSACFSLSITHGPAIRKRPPSPMRMPSTWKERDTSFKFQVSSFEKPQAQPIVGKNGEHPKLKT